MELCASVDDPDEIRAHPSLYRTIDETFPPFTEVWLLTSASENTLTSWASEVLPNGSRFEVDPPLPEEGLTALACSEWRFPLPMQ